MELSLLQERLSCKVCLDLPADHKVDIYQCINGHLICEECYGHLRSSFDDTSDEGDDADITEEPPACPTCRDIFVIMKDGKPQRSLLAKQLRSDAKESIDKSKKDDKQEVEDLMDVDLDFGSLMVVDDEKSHWDFLANRTLQRIGVPFERDAQLQANLARLMEIVQKDLAGSSKLGDASARHWSRFTEEDFAGCDFAYQRSLYD